MSDGCGRSIWRWLGYLGRWSPIGYVPAIVIIAWLDGAGGGDLARRWATSPRLVDHGRLWTLFTSAFVLDHAHPLQLVLAAVLTWALVLRHGAGTLWTAFVLGHVGSTLVAYAGTGVLWETGPHLHDAYVSLDFGISCVWRTILAMLATDALLALRPRPQSWAAALILAASSIALTAAHDGSIAQAEHALAVAAGIGCVLWTGRSLIASGSAPLASVTA